MTHCWCRLVQHLQNDCNHGDPSHHADILQQKVLLRGILIHLAICDLVLWSIRLCNTHMLPYNYSIVID